MPAEKWRSVKGFESEYEVSSEGRVRTVERYILSRNAHGPYKAKRGVRYLRLQDDKYGYKTAHLYKDGNHFLKKVHRLVAEVFVEGEEEGLVVHHMDNNKQNNSPSNLFWCTAEENARRAKEDGCYIRGSSHPKNKFDKWDLVFLDYFSKKYPLKEVAEAFNTSVSTVSLFRNNKHWSQEENNYAV